MASEDSRGGGTRRSTGGAGGSAGAGEAEGRSRPEGRRERKKRKTRESISDIATGLFLERGFNAVTLAEIADAADVSVNTIYNYFPSKEDIFLDRAEEMTDRPSRLVRERTPGESAAEAVFGRLREDIRAHSLYAGMRPGYEQFMQCVGEAPTLLARLSVIHQRSADRLTETLREEVGAEPEDPAPGLVAEQLVLVTHVVFRAAMRSFMVDAVPEKAEEEALHRVDVAESMLTGVVHDYARRERS